MRTVYTDIASGIIDKLCFKSFDVPFAKGLGPSLRIREWELLKLGVKKIMDEHNGVVTSAMLTEEGIPRLYLKQLRDRGELEFASRGIYVSSNAFEDEMYIL